MIPLFSHTYKSAIFAINLVGKSIGYIDVNPEATNLRFQSSGFDRKSGKDIVPDFSPGHFEIAISSF